MGASIYDVLKERRVEKNQSSPVSFLPNGPMRDSHLIKLANGSSSFGQNETDDDDERPTSLWTARGRDKTTEI